MSDLIATLNDKQKEAVLTTEGPLLIVAGAGSGKTRALTHRIAYIMAEKKVSAQNILAVTFTNKAANEMKQRIINLSQVPQNSAWQNPHLPTIGTFHAVCVRILRKHLDVLGFENAFAIYDTADQHALMREIMKEAQIDEKKMNPRAILSHISGAKNELIGPDKYHEMAYNMFTMQVAKLYTLYQQRLQKNQALDFDDIIMKTVTLFRSEEKILNYYQEKFRYISVDEYQDTNEAQYVLIHMLAKKYRNICVIGDSDQSIYSWRGANMQNILNFSKDYPDAKVILLEQNYRSTPVILDGAHAVIVKNQKRVEKKMWTERAGGSKIQLISAHDEREEGEVIAKQIERHLRDDGAKTYRDFVVLYRMNAQSRVLEEVFLRYGIPYRIVGGVKFYERKEIKDMLAYLRVVQNPADSVSLLRIINTPARDVGSKTIEVLQMYAAVNQCTLFVAMDHVDLIDDLTDAKKERLKKFVAMLHDLRKLNREYAVAGLIKHILSQTGYKKFIDDGSPEGNERLENVKELISVAEKYDGLEPGLALDTFLEEVALITDLDMLDMARASGNIQDQKGLFGNTAKENAVTLMTLHAAKGLEFPTVFICGLEEGIFPHSRSMLEPAELEEERRLMYVGMTRAKNVLYLLNARERLLYGERCQNGPSQFLQDIPENACERRDASGMLISIEGVLSPLRPVPVEGAVMTESETERARLFKDGDRVLHKTFGEGLVMSIVGGVITVIFKDARIGIKKLAVAIAPLEKM